MCSSGASHSGELVGRCGCTRRESRSLKSHCTWATKSSARKWGYKTHTELFEPHKIVTEARSEPIPNVFNPAVMFSEDRLETRSKNKRFAEQMARWILKHALHTKTLSGLRGCVIENECSPWDHLIGSHIGYAFTTGQVPVIEAMIKKKLEKRRFVVKSLKLYRKTETKGRWEWWKATRRRDLVRIEWNLDPKFDFPSFVGK